MDKIKINKREKCIYPTNIKFIIKKYYKFQKNNEITDYLGPIIQINIEDL